MAFVTLVGWDKSLFEYLTLYANPPWLTTLSEKLGNPATFAIPVGIFLLLYFALNRFRFAKFLLFVVVLLACSEGVAQLLKITVARPRPAVEWLIYVDAKALGFPSAHAVNTMALAFFLARWFGKSLLWYLPIPIVIGISRVLANYHYPLDVVGGWAIGYCVAASLWSLAQRFFPEFCSD